MASLCNLPLKREWEKRLWSSIPQSMRELEPVVADSAENTNRL